MADAALTAPAARRRAARALGDAALIAALATADAAVWAEFDARFRPLLEGYARRVGIPRALWPQCVDEVLEDEAMRWADGAPGPRHAAAYLVRAVYHRLLRARRAAARREHRYAAPEALDTPAGAGGAERVVRRLCSEAVLRASAGPRAGDGAPPAWADGTEEAGASAAITRAARALAARLTDDERQLLVWVAEQVPRRQIAEWTGDNYEATRKRIQRLTARLQAAAHRYAQTLPAAERHELERFFRRAGAPAGAARAGGAPSRSPRATPPEGDSP